ncbi:MAG: HAMP domain-containing histidine kinase [Lachnospiraceae bacterium]|nr:HAMP domain-containing histidine kinase [Lachnospiraceae bacterium]
MRIKIKSFILRRNKERNDTTTERNAMKKRPKVYRFLACHITALALALWFFATALLTWAVAKDMYHQVEAGATEYAYQYRIRRDSNEFPELPGAMESVMISDLGVPYYAIHLRQLLPIVLPQTPQKGMSSDQWFWGKWDLVYGFEPAVLYADHSDGSILTSGNYLNFSYTTDEEWNSGDTATLGMAYIDLNDLDGGLEALGHLINDFPGGSIGISYYTTLARLEGYFEGNEFHPVTIDRGHCYSDWGEDVRDLDSLNALDHQNKVEWTNLFTLKNAPSRPTQTIYAWELSGILSDYDPVTLNGTTYDSLPQLLEVQYNDPETFYQKDNNLLESVFIRRRFNAEDSYGTFDFLLAVRCWPLGYAVLRLIPAYLLSFILVFIAIRLILWKIRIVVTEPLAYLADALENGIHIYPLSPSDEICRVEACVADARQKEAETRNEIAQLKTALNFARNAEENRRQLISNITHELKTPLAVIHSYAEGLQAGIAADKQERYLSVILDETERMDAMVLQMLDLSRLEAGKVRLAADQFSLLQLTQSVAEKLAPMLEVKELTLSYGLTEDFLITADEGRIRQVLTNLLSNALKYTDAGGRILINVYVQGRNARFSIINTADHLPAVALSKIWDSFYRVDASRTEPGTGLGLTLVKSIVELHQGSCYVRNTVDKTVDPAQSAVEFGFSIPLR